MHLSPGIFPIILLCSCYIPASSNAKNGLKDLGSSMDVWEVARQNKITQQILQSFLEKKLFPNLRRPINRPPTLWDILPKTDQVTAPSKNIQDLINQTEPPVQETLQFVESEQIASVYDEFYDNYEGMCI